MIWRIARSRGVIPLLLILAAFIYWKVRTRAPAAVEIGYVGDRAATIWNTLAQVRTPVTELHYGDRVEVVREEGAAVQVRSASGAVGWMTDRRQLMDSDLWGKSASLLTEAREMPVQASGQTKTVSNVRVEPGRDAKRIFQLARGTPVVVLKRTVADAPKRALTIRVIKAAQSRLSKVQKKEDWLLILRAGDPAPNDSKAKTVPNSSQPINRASGDPVSGSPRGQQPDPSGVTAPPNPIAGWVLARFIELNLPEPVKDYASSADLHVVAWFELNRVPDGAGGEAPQYLVAGTRGGEGQPCDFTILRVYTWGAARRRYETAYIESNLCGRLPIHVARDASGPQFQFAESGGSSTVRTYAMRQTTVRRVKDPAPPNPAAQATTLRR